MDVSSEMHRAFPVNRVPVGRVRRTEELRLQTDAHSRLIYRQSQNAIRGLPGGTARGPSQHLDAANHSINNLHGKLWRTEPLSIETQADLPGEPASGRWGQDAFDPQFLPGGNHSYPPLRAFYSKVVRQVGMFQEIQNQIRLDVRWQIFPGIINDWG